MKQRIITAIIGIILLVTIVLLGKYAITPSIIILSFMGLYEFYSAFKKRNKTLIIPSMLFSALYYISLIYFKSYVIMIPILFFMFLLITLVIKHSKYNVIDIAVTFFGYIYATVLFSHFLLLSKIDDTNLLWIFILFSIAWGADMGGYFIGVCFGRHKLCEELSPKKTIEGSIGGTVFSIILTFVTLGVYSYFGVLDPSKIFNITQILIIIIASGLLSIIAQIGDLVASSIKRYTGVKDYSNIMPGHGGILDRFDSIIFIAPILYYIAQMVYEYII